MRDKLQLHKACRNIVQAKNNSLLVLVFAPLIITVLAFWVAPEFAGPLGGRIIGLLTAVIAAGIFVPRIPAALRDNQAECPRCEGIVELKKQDREVHVICPDCAYDLPTGMNLLLHR